MMKHALCFALVAITACAGRSPNDVVPRNELPNPNGDDQITPPNDDPDVNLGQGDGPCSLIDVVKPTCERQGSAPLGSTIYGPELDASGACRVETDDGIDGTIERAERTMLAGTNESWVERDDDGDGDFETAVHTQRDQAGNKTEEATTVERTLARLEAWTYGKDGQLLQWVKDLDGDGTVDVRQVSDYDNDGRRIAQREEDGDGNAFWSTTWTWNDRGHLAEMSQDTDGDGNIDEVRIYKNDDMGRIIHTTIDIDADGTIDATDDVERDEAGNEVLTVHTSRYGTRVATHTYGCEGQRLLDQYDDDGDGSFDRATVNAYDGNGALVLSYEVNPTSCLVGIVDHMVRGDDGRIMRVESGRGSIDGPYDDQSLIARYDAEGRLRTLDVDSTGNGTPDVRRRFSYCD